MRFKNYLAENYHIILEKVEILSDTSFIKKINKRLYKFENDGVIYDFIIDSTNVEGRVMFDEITFIPVKDGIRSIRKQETGKSKMMLFSKVITCLVEYIKSNKPNRFLINAADIGLISLYQTLFSKFKKQEPLGNYHFLPEYHIHPAPFVTFYFYKHEEDSEILGSYNEEDYEQFIRAIRKDK